MLDLISTADFKSLIVFLTTFLIVYLNTRRPSAVPPGPALWPVIGNVLSLAGGPVIQLEKLRFKYGDVIGLYIGSSLTIVVNGYDAVKEVLVKRGRAFSWRPETNYIMNCLPVKCMGFANGETWKGNKRFAMDAIQRLCFDRRSAGIEVKVNEELSFFVEKLKSGPETVDIGNDINLSIANVMWAIIFGRRCGYEDDKMRWYLARCDIRSKTWMRNRLLVDCFPFLTSLPNVNAIDLKSEEWSKELREFFKSRFLEVDDEFAEDGETCFVHMLVTRVRAEGFSSLRQAFADDSGRCLVAHELLIAGSETTATTIKWILMYLIREPHIQDKAREEIDRVLGRDETVSVQHRKHMPFIEAVVMEGLRLSHAVPLAVPHSVQHETTLRGFIIPKNTSVLVNLASVLKDPRVYPDPDIYRPERFLSDDGKAVVVPEEFVPFSKGPRSCPGESLARIELFMYITTLLQKFYFRCPDGQPLPEIDGIMGLTYQPKPYKIKIIPR